MYELQNIRQKRHGATKKKIERSINKAEKGYCLILGLKKKEKTNSLRRYRASNATNKQTKY
jgi:hypothetical protein